MAGYRARFFDQSAGNIYWPVPLRVAPPARVIMAKRGVGAHNLVGLTAARLDRGTADL